MSDLLIHDIPTEVANTLTERARVAGLDLQEWSRQHLIKLGQLPVVNDKYTFRVSGPGDGVRGFIRRFGGKGRIRAEIRPIMPLTAQQRFAFRKAGDYVQRNDPGDREKAFKCLSDAFEIVYELP